MVDPNFWRGRRVLVTGHTGFKGGWLSLWLQHKGAVVAGFSLPAPTMPSLFDSARVAEGMASHIGDIREPSELLQAFNAQQPEIVFHLAAQPLVRRSYADPVETYATNVMGTINVLEAVRKTASVKAAVAVTSDKCYENTGRMVSYRESDPMGGYDPYSSSKGCAELVASAYRRSFFQAAGVGLATVRAGNVLGGGDWAEDRLIPDFVRAGLAGETLRLRSPSAVRPWQHVLEALAGYLTLAERLWESADFAGSYNFGPDASNIASVLEVVRGFERHWGEPAAVEVEPDGGRLHESGFLAVDSTKARLKLGWRPRFSLDEALTWTAEWYRLDKAGNDSRETTLRQIAGYESLPSEGDVASAVASVD